MPRSFLWQCVFTCHVNPCCSRCESTNWLYWFYYIYIPHSLQVLCCWLGHVFILKVLTHREQDDTTHLSYADMRAIGQQNFSSHTKGDAKMCSKYAGLSVALKERKDVNIGHEMFFVSIWIYLLFIESFWKRFKLKKKKLDLKLCVVKFHFACVKRTTFVSTTA